MMAVGGIVLFAYAYEDGFNGTGRVDSAIGVALSVGSAIGAASYKVNVCRLRYLLPYTKTQPIVCVVMLCYPPVHSSYLVYIYIYILWHI